MQFSNEDHAIFQCWNIADLGTASQLLSLENTGRPIHRLRKNNARGASKNGNELSQNLADPRDLDFRPQPCVLRGWRIWLPWKEERRQGISDVNATSKKNRTSEISNVQDHLEKRRDRREFARAAALTPPPLQLRRFSWGWFAAPSAEGASHMLVRFRLRCGIVATVRGAPSAEGAACLCCWRALVFVFAIQISGGGKRIHKRNDTKTKTRALRTRPRNNGAQGSTKQADYALHSSARLVDPEDHTYMQRIISSPTKPKLTDELSQRNSNVRSTTSKFQEHREFGK